MVDFGTNSTRLLVADVVGGAAEPLERRSEVTRLGEGVDSSGRLADHAMERVFSTVAGYRELMDGLEVDQTIGVATSAVRDSENGDEFRATLRERYGVEVRDHRRRGGGAAHLPGRDGPARARRVGAGGRHRRREHRVRGGRRRRGALVPGLDAGWARSGRPSATCTATRRRSEELDALRAEAREILSREVPEDVRRDVSVGIAVAGTATQLAAVDLELDPYDPDRVRRPPAEPGRRARRCSTAWRRCRSRSGGRSSGLDPDRAPTIVAGAAILLESMTAFGLDGGRSQRGGPAPRGRAERRGGRPEG